MRLLLSWGLLFVILLPAGGRLESRMLGDKIPGLEELFKLSEGLGLILLAALFFSALFPLLARL